MCEANSQKTNFSICATIAHQRTARHNRMEAYTITSCLEDEGGVQNQLSYHMLPG